LQAEIRQLVIDPYIVDLVCRDVKLAIELDGSQHADAQTYDERHICKAKNNEVEENPDGAAEFVLARCAERLDGATHPQPLPSREGRKRRPRLRKPD